MDSPGYPLNSRVSTAVVSIRCRYIYIYIPRPSKGLRFGTPIECSLRGYVSTPLSRTKKTQQDMVITCDNNVHSTIFGRHGWRRAEQQKL